MKILTISDVRKNLAAVVDSVIDDAGLLEERALADPETPAHPSPRAAA